MPEGDWILAYRDYYYIKPCLFASRLEAEDIPTLLIDENMGSMLWNSARAVGGVRLYVPAQTRERALVIVKRPWAEDVDELGVLRCPECDSLNINYEPYVPGIAIGGAVLANFLLPIAHKKWRCVDCRRLFIRENV